MSTRETRITAGAILTVLLLASSVERSGAQQQEPATLVLTNARITTMDPRLPRAEALAARGELIVAVGSVEEIRPLIGAQTKVIDVGGRLVMPGFNDSHAHFPGGAAGLSRLNLYGVNSIAEVQRLVAAEVAKAKPGEWITGARYDHTLWGGAWPTRADLDKVSPNNPVALSRASGHSTWANSLALKLSGITNDVPNPPAGEIQKDPKTGEPTGILLETAAGLLKIVRPNLTPEEARAKQRLDMLIGMRHAAMLGLTTVQTNSSLAGMDYMRQLRSEGLLTVRWTGWFTLAEAARLGARGMRSGQGDDWVRVGFLKGFIDGTLGDGTAAMFEPFTDRPESKGLPRMTQRRLDSMVILADRLGFQVGIHAIGDQGVHMVLNAYEQAALINGTKDIRHRVEHAQLIAPPDIQRFGKLGVVASMQPTHATTDMRFAETRVGRERVKTAYPWRSLIASGGVIAFGTDWSVEPLDPMRGVFSAYARMNIEKMEPTDGWLPEQKLTMWESLYYYTWGSAFGEHMEHVKGSLAPGRFADIVVLDKDLYRIPAAEILTTKVDYTIVGGRVVWDRATGTFAGDAALALARAK